MTWLRTTALLVVAAFAAGLLASCSGSAPASSDPPSAAQVRLDAFASVAKRIYAQEHAPIIGRVAAKHLERNAALLRALASGDRATIRAEARKPVFAHEVRVRLGKGSNVLMDAGLPFVVEGSHGTLHGSNGERLGSVDVSIQDVIGFVKLVDRETGTKTVVRGRHGIVQTLFPAAARAHLPASGTVTIRGHSYLVRSFHELDFNHNPMTVWLLDRV